MNENLIKKINGLLTNIVNQTKDSPDEAVNKINTVEKELDSIVSEGTEDRLFIESNIYEAKGDVYVKCRKPANAEVQYGTMLEKARQLYLNDKEGHSYTYAKAARKCAALYELLLGINHTVPLPRQLSESDNKLLDKAEILHKYAIGATYKNGTSVDAKIVRLHADSHYKIGCIYSLRNKLDEAEEHFRNSMELGRAMFTALRTKEQSYLASRSESAVNVMYMLRSKHKESVELNKSIIERLKTIEPTDPAFFGRQIAMAHLSTGKSYSSIEGEKYNAMDEYHAALEKICKVNEISERKCTEDVIMFSIAVGDFYKRLGMTANASVYYNYAVANIKNLPEGKCSAACKNALDRITGKSNKEKA